MRGAHRHQDADLANAQLADAVVDDHTVGIWPALLNLSGNIGEDLQGHGLIGLVFQVIDRAAIGVVSNSAAHHHHGPIARMVGLLVDTVDGQGSQGNLEGSLQDGQEHDSSQ